MKAFWNPMRYGIQIGAPRPKPIDPGNEGQACRHPGRETTPGVQQLPLPPGSWRIGTGGRNHEIFHRGTPQKTSPPRSVERRAPEKTQVNKRFEKEYK